MKISRQGISFIKKKEGFSEKIYKDIAGKPTIGYGHLIKPGEVFSGPITEVMAEALLTRDLKWAEQTVNAMVSVELLQNQFDALVSLVFNIGAVNFANSTLLKKLNVKDYSAAAAQFLVWDKITDPKTRKKIVSRGLAARRKEERDIFINTMN